MYRLTQGNIQARFDSLGRLINLGHPDKLKKQHSCFHLNGPLREGNWYLHCGHHEVLFDPETSIRQFHFNPPQLTIKTILTGPSHWKFELEKTYSIENELLRCDFKLTNITLWNYPTNYQEQTIKNNISAPIRRLRYCTGINCWTEFAPEWNHRPYPTNIRIEQDFFWAGLISKDYDIIGVFSNCKVDNWHIWYDHPGSVRIVSLGIDFINSIDVHPTRWKHQEVILDGNQPTYNGTFYIGRFYTMETLWQKISDMLNVSFLIPQRCSGFEKETLTIPVIHPSNSSNPINVNIYDKDTNTLLNNYNLNENHISLSLKEGINYQIIRLDNGGKKTEACFWQQKDWKQILQTAGTYTAIHKIPSVYNSESLLGLITLCQCAEFFDDKVCQVKAHEIMKQVYTYYDPETGCQRNTEWRPQNYGTLLDAIRIYHRAFRTDKYLILGQKCARYLMKSQSIDGNFYGMEGRIYNNVIYPVKSLFDWSLHLREHGLTTEADEIHVCIERAYRNIVHDGDDTVTEGYDTYEDGMTSCAGYQIAALWPYFGRHLEDLKVAINIFNNRRMFKPRVPDARFFASTLRHWEGLWALGLGSCMLGGHGWNAWSASFSHSLFMATGNWNYLIDAYATIANCVQSVDINNGVFNFGFAVDPYWYNFLGFGSQQIGETYISVPDGIPFSNESHQTFFTLDTSFFHQTYVKLLKTGVEVLNGRILSMTPEVINLETFALNSENEVIVIRDNSNVKIPHFTIKGKTTKTIIVENYIL
jgi:hypothetical protein